MNTPGSYRDGLSPAESNERIPESLVSTNLIFPINPQGQILLYVKVDSKGNFDEALGKRNGLGGKKEGDESKIESAIREIKEEGKIIITEEQLKKVGTVRFYRRSKHNRNQECDVYIVENFTGEYSESDEMKDPQWFDRDNLPLDKMRSSDTQRLPQVLNGEYTHVVTYCEDDGTVIECKFLDSFDEVDLEFFTKR